MTYRIVELDGFDDDDATELRILHTLTFGTAAAQPNFDHGIWWVAIEVKSGVRVGFIGAKRSTMFRHMLYLERVGVLPQHRGRGLQRRLMRAVEKRCKRMNWRGIISDTTDNIPSANNFIVSGYKLFQPTRPWSFATALYWRKDF